MNRQPKILPGQSFPLGSTVFPDGVNFCVFSKNCEAVELLLFDSHELSRPQTVVRLDPQTNRTFYYWHCFIPGLRSGQHYGYRVHGPYIPELGYRFDGSKVLVDPYARAVEMGNYQREYSVFPGDNCAQSIKSVVVGPDDYDWHDDRPLNRPFSRSVIYELHVGGFTRDPSSGLSTVLRGTFAGLIQKIPYLKDLGVTAVELMPIQQFDPQDTPSGLTNYWGYSPIALFALHHEYGTSNDPLQTIREFKDMVRALHQAGIEVILDVVFNHTAEGDQRGPCLSFKGFENKAYYQLGNDGLAHYLNFSGTGNCLNANQSIVRRLIMDCLRYWVSEMHIDGFRFDLAAVLSRNQQGQVDGEAPILWEIESDPILAPAKIIAEAWDVGSYQMGSFLGHKWAEWNDRFRDDVRGFLKGDSGKVLDFALRFTGSKDLFGGARDPNRSINFVCCHDGFTLNDLVSYNQKHNASNGEDNRDGSNDNRSWNCGIEGPTDSEGVVQLRSQQIKNFFTILLFSMGTPMFPMGDECRRTQSGNNNAYCQDNNISWFDWTAASTEASLLAFVRQLIRLNHEIEFFNESAFWNTEIQGSGSTICWHGVQLGRPDWSHESHSIAFTLTNPKYTYALHVMINAYWKDLMFDAPPLPRENMASWYTLVNTAAPDGQDIFELANMPAVSQFSHLVKARSILALIAK